jgi:hypothetical protein
MTPPEAAKTTAPIVQSIGVPRAVFCGRNIHIRNSMRKRADKERGKRTTQINDCMPTIEIYTCHGTAAPLARTAKTPPNPDFQDGTSAARAAPSAQSIAAPWRFLCTRHSVGRGEEGRTSVFKSLPVESGRLGTSTDVACQSTQSHGNSYAANNTHKVPIIPSTQQAHTTICTFLCGACSARPTLNQRSINASAKQYLASSSWSTFGCMPRTSFHSRPQYCLPLVASSSGKVDGGDTRRK